MKSGQIASITLIMLALGGYSGFKSGEWWQGRQDQETAVRADAAFWNPKTKEFTWGIPEASGLENTHVADVINDARKPPRKPNIVVTK